MLLAFRTLASRCRVLTATPSSPIGSRIAVNRLRTFSAYYSVKTTTTQTRRLISVIMASHSQQGDISGNQLVICKYEKITDLSLSFFLLSTNLILWLLLLHAYIPPPTHTCTPITHTYMHIVQCMLQTFTWHLIMSRG